MQVMLLGFVLLGRSLEERAKLKASSDMNELLVSWKFLDSLPKINLSAFPSFFLTWNLFLQSLISTQSRLVITSSDNNTATDSVLSSDSICMNVPVDDIRVGDSLLVLPGETFPVDVSVSVFLTSYDFLSCLSMLNCLILAKNNCMVFGKEVMKFYLIGW